MQASNKISFWQSLHDYIDSGFKLCLLAVLDSEGSSPGRTGFIMAIMNNGEMLGSIGGGIMEHKLVEFARMLLLKNQQAPLLKRQIHRSEGHDRSGMICSGEQTIGIYMLDKKDLTWLLKVIEHSKNNMLASLLFNHIGISFKENPDEKADLNVFGEEWEKTIDIFDIDQVHIIGAGHVGLALSKIMSHLDFQVYIYDHRSDLYTMRSNRSAHYKQVLDYDDIARHIPEGDHIYVVIMTFGYRYDEVCIKKLSNHKIRYLGVMGSSAKMNVMMTSLLDEGYSQSYLDSIHTPIGIMINSRTPEEIAISISAQIIKEKNKLYI